MQYPIFIHKDPNSEFGVIVPDLLLNQPIEQHLDNADFKDGVLALINISEWGSPADDEAYHNL